MIYVTVSISLANLLVLLSIFYKVSIVLYRVDLMWRDYAARHGLNGKG